MRFPKGEFSDGFLSQCDFTITGFCVKYDFSFQFSTTVLVYFLLLCSERILLPWDAPHPWLLSPTCIWDILLSKESNKSGKTKFLISSSLDLSRMTGNFSNKVTDAWMLLGLEKTGLKCIQRIRKIRSLFSILFLHSYLRDGKIRSVYSWGLHSPTKNKTGSKTAAKTSWLRISCSNNGQVCWNQSFFKKEKKVFLKFQFRGTYPGNEREDLSHGHPKKLCFLAWILHANHVKELQSLDGRITKN